MADKFGGRSLWKAWKGENTSMLYFFNVGIVWKQKQAFEIN